MKKVGVCGHFGIGLDLSNGQTIKTKIVTKELVRQFGNEQVEIVDSHGGVKSILRIIEQSFRMFEHCENIVIMPAHKGLRVLAPIYANYNLLFHRKIHYVVIGGWLDGFLDKYKWLSKILKKFTGIYVETLTMKQALEKKGFENVVVMANFKNLKILTPEELIYNQKEPYKVCTFSRVMEEKGIEDAVCAVQRINRNAGRLVYTLDIYGQVWKNYEEKFEKLQQNFPAGVSYKGVVPFDQSVDVLKEYFALLFPTRYEGEGFAGTLLDAMAAGVPVVASDWRYNHEIVVPGETGVLLPMCTAQKLEEELVEMAKVPNKWNEMKKSSLQEAKKYIPAVAIQPLLDRMK